MFAYFLKYWFATLEENWFPAKAAFGGKIPYGVYKRKVTKLAVGGSTTVSFVEKKKITSGMQTITLQFTALIYLILT